MFYLAEQAHIEPTSGLPPWNLDWIYCAFALFVLVSLVMTAIFQSTLNSRNRIVSYRVVRPRKKSKELVKTLSTGLVTVLLLP